MGTGVKQHISDEGGSDEALGEMQLGELPHALQTTLAIFIKETFKCSLIFQRFHCSRSNKLRQSQAMQAEPKAVHGGEQHCCLPGSAAPTQQQCSPRKACTMLGCSCLAQSWWLCSAAGHVEQQAGMVHGDRALQGSCAQSCIMCAPLACSLFTLCMLPEHPLVHLPVHALYPSLCMCLYPFMHPHTHLFCAPSSALTFLPCSPSCAPSVPSPIHPSCAPLCTHLCTPMCTPCAPSMHPHVHNWYPPVQPYATPMHPLHSPMCIPLLSTCIPMCTSHASPYAPPMHPLRTFFAPIQTPCTPNAPSVHSP